MKEAREGAHGVRRGEAPHLTPKEQLPGVEPTAHLPVHPQAPPRPPTSRAPEKAVLGYAVVLDPSRSSGSRTAMAGKGVKINRYVYVDPSPQGLGAAIVRGMQREKASKPDDLQAR